MLISVADGEEALSPQMLPDGESVLFTVQQSRAGEWADQVVVQSLATKERRVVIEGGRDARYVETGHLVYTRRGALLAVPFSLRTLSVTPGAVPLVDVAGAAMTTASSTAGARTVALLQFSLSKTGSLVYRATLSS